MTHLRPTPAERSVADIMACMTADRESFGHAVAVVLGLLAREDDDPYRFLHRAAVTAEGIVTGDGIEGHA